MRFYKFRLFSGSAVTVRIDDLLHARAFIAAVMGGWYLCNRMNDIRMPLICQLEWDVERAQGQIFRESRHS